MKLSRDQMISAIIAHRLSSMDLRDLTRFYTEAETHEFAYASLDEIADIYYQEVEELA